MKSFGPEMSSKMNRVLTNPEQYSQLWRKESEFLEAYGIYEGMSKLTPSGNVLEFGCGIGKGTRHLSIGRSVLSLDSNSYLIEEANISPDVCLPSVEYVHFVKRCCRVIGFTLDFSGSSSGADYHS